MTKSRAARGAVALAVVAAVVVYATADQDGLVAYTCRLGVLLSGSVGAWIGAQRATRGRRLVPRLIAAGVSFSALGHVMLGVLASIGAETAVSIADLSFFASYALFGAAVWIVLQRSRSGSAARVDVDFLVDTLTIVVVTVLVSWSLSVDAIAADDSVPPLTRLVWAMYPLASSVLFALAMRAQMSRSARTAIGVSFAVGTGLVLAGDLIYLQAPQSGVALLVMNVAWLLAPILAARSAWRDCDVPTDATGSTALGGWSLMVAIGPLFVPPALVLITYLRGEPDHPLQFIIGTVAVALLAFVRTARLIRSEGEARRELEAARDLAQEASLAKSTFLANMSHEIRTPLTTVLATAEILEDTLLDDGQVQLLGRMHRQGDLLKSLVEGILDFSRIESGQLELTSTPFDLHAMVADAADVYTLRAIQAGIRFECDLDPSVPRMVVGDPGRLFQVLTNLLDNALKFTHQGTVALTVRRAATDAADDGAGGAVLEFIVNDTGIGIPAQDTKSVFESFRQVDGSTTRRYGGSGLGLAICKELTQLMGGSITVHSDLGAGSTFAVRIPLAHAHHELATPLPVVPLKG